MSRSILTTPLHDQPQVQNVICSTLAKAPLCANCGLKRTNHRHVGGDDGSQNVTSITFLRNCAAGLVGGRCYCGSRKTTPGAAKSCSARPRENGNVEL
jgi:hypothetical protein